LPIVKHFHIVQVETDIENPLILTHQLDILGKQSFLFLRPNKNMYKSMTMMLKSKHNIFDPLNPKQAIFLP